MPDLGVCRLAEVVVPRAHCPEEARDLENNHAIGLLLHQAHRVSRCDRDGNPHLSRLSRPDHSYRRSGGRSRRQTVVDDYRRLGRRVGRWVGLPINRDTAVQFGLLTCHDPVETLRRHVDQPENLIVPDHEPTLTNGPHRQFRLVRNSDLSHNQDVEITTQRLSDRGRHRHATAGQRQHHGVWRIQFGERLTQQDPGLMAIGIPHLGIPGYVALQPGHHVIQVFGRLIHGEGTSRIVHQHDLTRRVEPVELALVG